MTLSLIALIAVGCSRRVSAEPSGAALDLSGYSLSFDEEFADLSIAKQYGARWSAHTPWSGDFGDAQFSDPGPSGPFSLTRDGLRIAATRNAEGRWRSGLICSVDKDGPGQKGFTQKYGYFEMQAKLPDGVGTWPAFWLIGSDKSQSSAEVDVVEFYGNAPGVYRSAGHIWQGGKDLLSIGKVIDVPTGSLTRQFNTFGVLIDERLTRFYFNRREVFAYPTPPQYRQPMYNLADLALGSGWPISGLQSPVNMDIRYIRAYRLAPPASP